jgi:hypothetical protein
LVEKGRKKVLSEIELRLKELRHLWGDASHTLLLPVNAPKGERRGMRTSFLGCVVQTVFPCSSDLTPADLELNAPATRRTHRRHLSAALAAVESQLRLRSTHGGGEASLDLLILPELAVHPDDVDRHLVPFARRHKAMVLAGITYQRVFAGQPS